MERNTIEKAQNHIENIVDYDAVLRANAFEKRSQKDAFDALKEQGKKGVHILVRKGHAGAIACYTALGFQQIGECSLFEKEFICMEREL